MAHEEIISETLKNYVTSSNNLQKNNFYDLTSMFEQLQKHVQHSMLYLLDRYILSLHLPISWHTYGDHTYLCHDTCKCNFLHELLTIHWNIYLFIKNTIMHTLHINFFGCTLAHEGIMSETLKNYVTNSNNIQESELIWSNAELWTTPKNLSHSWFSVLHAYILSPHLPISWYTYGDHTWLSNHTYKCYFFASTANNTLKYKLVYKKQQ